MLRMGSTGLGITVAVPGAPVRLIGLADRIASEMALVNSCISGDNCIRPVAVGVVEGLDGVAQGIGVAGTANHGLPIAVCPMTTPLRMGCRVAGPMNPGGSGGGSSIGGGMYCGRFIGGRGGRMNPNGGCCWN